MNTNFDTFLKKTAINKVDSFSGFTTRNIKVISNSPKYPNSVTLSMDIYCDNVNGYIFNNSATDEHYALTAIQLSNILNEMIKSHKCWKPRSREADLLRITFDMISNYKF